MPSVNKYAVTNVVQYPHHHVASLCHNELTQVRVISLRIFMHKECYWSEQHSMTLMTLVMDYNSKSQTADIFPGKTAPIFTFSLHSRNWNINIKCTYWIWCISIMDDLRGVRWHPVILFNSVITGLDSWRYNFEIFMDENIVSFQRIAFWYWCMKSIKLGLWYQKLVTQAWISNCTPQYSVGCNYLSMPNIPASSAKVLKS